MTKNLSVFSPWVKKKHEFNNIAQNMTCDNRAKIFKNILNIYEWSLINNLIQYMWIQTQMHVKYATNSVRDYENLHS